MKQLALIAVIGVLAGIIVFSGILLCGSGTQAVNTAVEKNQIELEQILDLEK